MACLVSAVSVTAVAEQNSEKINYENQFVYEKVDADENGTYDYIGIYSCNTDAAEVNVPEEIDGLPVEWVYDSAFYNAKNLKVINLPKTVKQLGYRSLYNTSLEAINADAENTEFSSEDGVLFDKGKETLIQYPSSKADEVYTVPETVTSVLGFSFEECKNLKNVTLSKNVNYLGNGAFEKCSALESVTFENPDCQFVEFAVSITNGYVDSKGYYNGVIYGYENSTAQAYAQKYDYNFAVIGAEPETTKPVVTEPIATTFVTTISNNELVASVRCDGCDGVIHGGPEWFVVTPQGTTLCLNCSEQYMNDTTEITESAEQMTFNSKTYTVLDDKGMFQQDDYYNRNDYKILYDGNYLEKALALNNQFRFVLKDSVSSEDADNRVNEIFNEVFPEEDYTESYMPIITSEMLDGMTYTVCISDNYFISKDNNVVVQAKEKSSEMMKKLNDEGLISAFYDIGECYEWTSYERPYIFHYEMSDDIESVKAFLESDSRYSDYHIYVYDDILNVGYCELECELESWTVPSLLSVAADIYEATSIAPLIFPSPDIYQVVYGENSLDKLMDTARPNPDLITIVGDLDLNDDVGIADAILLSKYITNAELYPIKDSTAAANADLNGDGLLNSLDISILIEIMLGSYEMVF